MVLLTKYGSTGDTIDLVRVPYQARDSQAAPCGEGGHAVTRDTVRADLRRAEGLLVQEVGGEVLVLDTETDRIHQLNATASQIWRLIDRGTAVAEIAEALASEFDLDNDKVEADVLRTVSRFRELNLLVPVELGPVASPRDSDRDDLTGRGSTDEQEAR